MQTTLKSTLSFTGIGLHSGRPAKMHVRPASAEYGIWIKRTDVIGRDQLIPAHWASVRQGELCTKLVNTDGIEVSTVEHVMAALAGCGVTNALIEVNGPEIPILDGSAAPFVAAILAKGVRRQSAPARALEILAPVEVSNGPAIARLEPARGFEMSFDIDFADAAIGRQSKILNLANGTFVHDLCDSRTFCRAQDIEAMRSRGLALGGTYDNAVVVDGDRVLSPGGLRHSDEAVRHKMLDALGDLALAGAPILGRYVGHRAGHALTNALLHAVFAQPNAVRLVDVDEATAARLPGVGLTASDAPRLVA